MYPFEDYSEKIIEQCSSTLKGKVFMFENCYNTNLISESSFSRLLSIIKNKDFAIITAYRKEFTKQQNIERNRILRGILNKNKLGPHQLVGQWKEAPDGMDYDTCPPNLLVTQIERSYLVAKSDRMSLKEFIDIIYECMTIGGKTQDAVLIHKAADNGFYLMFNNDKNEFLKIGTHISLNKMADIYSRYVKKMDIPFVFEGKEIPATLNGAKLFRLNNIK